VAGVGVAALGVPLLGFEKSELLTEAIYVASFLLSFFRFESNSKMTAFGLDLSLNVIAECRLMPLGAAPMPVARPAVYPEVDLNGFGSLNLRPVRIAPVCCLPIPGSLLRN
jgi:hypothetical protein